MSIDIVEKIVPSGRYKSNVLIAGNPSNPPLILMHGAGPGASASSN